MEKQIHVLICSPTAINIMKALDSIRPGNKSAPVFKGFSCMSTERLIDLMSRIKFDIVLVEDSMSEPMGWPAFLKNYNNDSAKTKILEENKKAVFYFLSSEEPEKAVMNALNVGYKDYFSKPLDLLVFQQKVKEDVPGADSLLEKPLYIFKVDETGDYAHKMELREISESHAVFVTPLAVPVGNIIKLASEALKSYGASDQIAEVRSCTPADGGHVIRVLFRGVRAEFTRAIRITAQREHIKKNTL